MTVNVIGDFTLTDDVGNKLEFTVLLDNAVDYTVGGKYNEIDGVLYANAPITFTVNEPTYPSAVIETSDFAAPPFSTPDSSIVGGVKSAALHRQRRLRADAHRRTRQFRFLCFHHTTEPHLCELERYIVFIDCGNLVRVPVL